MQRRHFIHLSGSALAGLFARQLAFASGSGNTMIQPPHEVYLRQGGRWIPLQSSNGSVYAGKDSQVEVRSGTSALSCHLQSPSEVTETVLFYWKLPVPFTGKCLGDHWERSYGDLAWKGPDIPAPEPWYVMIQDQKKITCFGVKTGANSICSWNLRPDGITLTMDVRSGGTGVELKDRRLYLCDIVTTQSLEHENAFETARRFCGMMCNAPRLPRQPVYGINDWYYAYGNNSPALIKEQTALLSGLADNTQNRPFSVIDAGWAAYSPLLPGDCCWQEDFSKPNDKFRDMSKMAADIMSLGMRPGLWTRPLCAKHDDPLHLLLPSIAGRDNPKNPILDPTIEENLERIKRNISLYREWGYELVKHDFTTFDILGKWGFQMTDDITTPGWRFSDNRKTTAEVINNLYHIIREAAGGMYLIGCNTMGHLSAGVFELNRVGDDTSGKEWGRTRKMGVNALGFRISQHNTFYATDADCVGLTKMIPWEKNKQWMQLVAESSTPLFISAEPDALGKEQRDFIRQSFTRASNVQPVGEPLDWLTNPLPSKWILNNKKESFNWD